MTTTHNETERAEFQLVRSIIHDCHAIKWPQTLLEKLGMTANIIPLKGATDEQANFILKALNTALLSSDAKPVQDGEWTVSMLAKASGAKMLTLMQRLLDAGHDVTANQPLSQEQIAVLLAADKPAESVGEAVCETGFPGRKIYKWFRRVPQGTLLYTHPQPQPVPDDVVKDAELSNAARDVITERRRQMEIEGWTPEHDDEHTTFAMATAAACYALHASAPGAENQYWTNARSKSSHVLWPWDFEWWKPSTPRRDLVKAAALILAEIERLDRSIIDAAMLKEGK